MTNKHISPDFIFAVQRDLRSNMIKFIAVAVNYFDMSVGGLHLSGVTERRIE